MSTLKALTKAQLIALVQDRNAEIQALRTDLSIANRNRVVTKPAYVRAPHVLPAHFVAAREAAMRLGRSVLATSSAAHA